MSSNTVRVSQLNAAALHRMYEARQYAEIDAARRAGQFDELLGADAPRPEIEGQWTQTDLDDAYARHEYNEIVRAHEAGQLDQLLGASAARREES